MNAIIKTINKVLLLSAALLPLAACQQVEFPERSSACELSSIIMNVRVPDIDPANVFYKSIEGVIDNEAGSIKFEVPYNMSEILDDVTDLSRVFLIASAPVGAEINPPLGGLRDMTEDMNITVTSGNGNIKEYVISAELKKSEAKNITSFGFSVNGHEFTGLCDEVNKKVTFMVATPDLREMLEDNPAIANVEVSNRARIVSPDFTQPVDFSEDVPVIVEAQDGSRAEWLIVQSEPVILDYGFGYTRKLWSLTSDQMGITGSGDYRSATVTKNYFVVSHRHQEHRMFDKVTGAFVGTAKAPYDYDSDKCGCMYVTTDAAGKLVSASFPSWSGGNFNLLYWKDGETSEPVRLIKKSGMGDSARKFAVVGNLSENAIVYVTSGKSNKVFKFYIENGVWNKDKDETILISGRTFAYMCTPCPLSDQPDSKYILVDQLTTGKGMVTLHNADGTLISSMTDGAKCTDGGGTGDGKVFTFNNAMYLMYIDIANTTNKKARIRIYDITDLDNFTMAFDNPLFNQFLVFQSDWAISSDNGNGTCSVAYEISDDGEEAYVYIMLTNGEALKYELTKIDI